MKINNLFSRYRKFVWYDDEDVPLILSFRAVIRQNGDNFLDTLTWDKEIANRIENELIIYRSTLQAFAKFGYDDKLHPIKLYKFLVPDEKLKEATEICGFSRGNFSSPKEWEVPPFCYMSGRKHDYINNIEEVLGFEVKRKRRGVSLIEEAKERHQKWLDETESQREKEKKLKENQQSIIGLGFDYNTLMFELHDLLNEKPKPFISIDVDKLQDYYSKRILQLASFYNTDHLKDLLNEAIKKYGVASKSCTDANAFPSITVGNKVLEKAGIEQPEIVVQGSPH